MTEDMIIILGNEYHILQNAVSERNSWISFWIAGGLILSFGWFLAIGKILCVYRQKKNKKKKKSQGKAMKKKIKYECTQKQTIVTIVFDYDMSYKSDMFFIGIASLLLFWVEFGMFFFFFISNNKIKENIKKFLKKKTLITDSNSPETTEKKINSI